MQRWTNMRSFVAIICLKFQLSGVKCQNELAGSQLNDSLNTNCYVESLSCLIPSYEHEVSSLQLNLSEIAEEFKELVMYHQNFRVKINEKDTVSLDCSLSTLCRRPFKLQTLMENNVTQIYRFLLVLEMKL